MVLQLDHSRNKPVVLQFRHICSSYFLLNLNREAQADLDAVSIHGDEDIDEIDKEIKTTTTSEKENNKTSTSKLFFQIPQTLTLKFKL